MGSHHAAHCNSKLIEIKSLSPVVSRDQSAASFIILTDTKYN